MSLRKPYDQNFEFFFWSVYPKRTCKAEAEREFLRLKFTQEQMAELKDHIEVRKKFDRRWLPNEKGSVFIPEPHRFLKNRRFEDDYERIYRKPPPKPPTEATEAPAWQVKGFPSPEAYRAHVDRVMRTELDKLGVRH